MNLSTDAAPRPHRALSKRQRRAARRARREAIALAGGTAAAPIRRGAPPADNPPLVALNARIRHGVSPQHASDVLSGAEIGRCLLVLAAPDERAALWQLWCDMDAARRAWRAICLGLDGNPAASRHDLVRDKLEADPSMRLDPRTPDERAAAARRSWAAWTGRLDSLPTPLHRHALAAALDGVEGAIWRDGAPTARGILAVSALRILGAP